MSSCVAGRVGCTFVIEGYTRDEIREEVNYHTGRYLSKKQFYEWLIYCLIEFPKGLYSYRDLKKFIYVSNHLKRFRSLDLARESLVKRLKTNPEEFTNDPL